MPNTMIILDSNALIGLDHRFGYYFRVRGTPLEPPLNLPLRKGETFAPSPLRRGRVGVGVTGVSAVGHGRIADHMVSSA